MADGKLIQYKKTKISKDTKGRDKIVFYLSPEQAQVLAAEVQANIGCERGIKLSFHTEERETPWGVREPSSFGFVNEVSEVGTGRPGAQPGKFVPKTKGPSAATKAKAAATLNTEVE